MIVYIDEYKRRINNRLVNRKKAGTLTRFFLKSFKSDPIKTQWATEDSNLQPTD